jgi:hypothetical protein
LPSGLEAYNAGTDTATDKNHRSIQHHESVEDQHEELYDVAKNGQLQTSHPEKQSIDTEKGKSD